MIDEHLTIAEFRAYSAGWKNGFLCGQKSFSAAYMAQMASTASAAMKEPLLQCGWEDYCNKTPATKRETK